MPTIAQIQIRRGTAAEWTAANTTLAAGEFGYETDSKRLKVGDGAAAWADLAYISPGPNSVVASSNIASLTSPQQTSIVVGTLVTTSDGRRWIYSGSGSKTSEASYVELADVTPDWSVVANKPSTFAPSAHASSHQTGQADAIAPVIISPATLSTSQNDYTPGACDIIRLSSSTAIDITGLIPATSDGGMRLILNTNAAGGANITLRHESTSSTAANRFRNTTGGDYVLPPDGGSAVLTYSNAISRWRIL